MGADELLRRFVVACKKLVREIVVKHRIAVLFALAALASVSAMAAKPVPPPPPPPTVSGMKVYAAGQPVGYVLSLYHGDYGDYLTIISETGYLAEFFPLTGAFLNLTQTQVVFTGTNCSGDAYAYTSSSSNTWKLRQGMAFKLGSQGYYSVRGATPSGVNYYSWRNSDGSCGNSSLLSNAQNAVPAFPNDMAVTGIPNEGLALPVVFGIP